MMNGRRKSDSCVVPAKSANKLTLVVRAEQMEGRRLVKGNARIPLDQPPSLHLLRPDHKRQLVRRLRRYYAAVRLPATVHHRRTSLDFTMRPKPTGLGSRRISRFSRRLFPCMLGV